MYMTDKGGRIKSCEMKKMKKLTIAMGLMMVALSAGAAETALQVALNGGRTETYLLKEKPVITCSGSDMLVKTQEVSGSYARSEVASMTFIEDAGSGVALAGDGPFYEYADGIFSCAGRQISVYGMQGAKVAEASGSVSFRELPAGVYVINIENRSIKVIKR